MKNMLQNRTKTMCLAFGGGFLMLSLGFTFRHSLQAGGQRNVGSDETRPGMIEVVPVPYDKALRNPLKGFTTRGIHDHPWATLAHSYIKWSDIENDESDGLDQIRRVTDKKWGNIASRNIKVIPRVYLDWNGKFWPADMTADDYTSEQFKRRVVRLIERLGILWDNDPRVAFVEMGVFGKWGEQEQPAATPEVDRLVADAFAKAFKKKHISVRRNWEMFTSQPFGVYWDSWAHYDQMWGHGNNIARLNASQGRYLKAYIGGEAAYDWGNATTQPGKNPTASVAEKRHRDFIINSIRWLHCTQLRWIENYDRTNTEAQAGADLIQQAFGYRYILEKVSFNPQLIDGTLQVSLRVKNTGSAPFYYDWPLEISLLNPADCSVVWKGKFTGVDIRQWLPGEGWTAPEWVEGKPHPNWVTRGTPGWTIPPKSHSASATFQPTVPTGRYILALAVLDPAGDLPSLRFATSQYLNGGRHPVGIVAVNQSGGGHLPRGMVFDDPAKDDSLHYKAE
jgi:hypothetical protein